jgi:membrane associated rhomboid family serine protease
MDKRMDGVLAWLNGRTPRQQEQLRRSLTHPVRTAAVFGAPYGVVMGVFLPGRFGPAAVGVGVVAGVAYGWAMVAWMRRRARNLDGT